MAIRTAGRSLRFQLGLLTLGLGLPTLVFVGVLLWRFADSERTRVEEQATALSSGLAVALDREVNGILSTLQALGTSPSLQARDLPAFYAQAMEIRRLQGIHVSLRSVEGFTVLTTRAPLGAAVPIPPLLAKTDQEIIRSGRATISNVFISATSAKPVFQIVAAPIAVAGVPTYLLAASIDLDFLAGVMRNEILPPGWTGAIVDQNGVFVVRTERQDEFAGRMASPTFRAHQGEQTGSYYGRNTAGREVLAGYARSALTNWTASANIGADVMNVPLRHSLVALAGLGALLAMIAAALGLIMARRVDHAMAQLAAAAAAIGRGEPLTPIVTPIAEVNQAAAALADAAHQVQDRARERDAAEAALRRLNDTLETQVAQRTLERDRAWRNSRDLQAVFSLEGVFEAVSPSVTAILGWQPDQLLGRTVSEFIHPDDRDATLLALRQSEAATQPEMECRSCHRDGSFRWISWVVAAEAGRLYASGRDVNAQKQQEAALQQAEAALRQSQKMEAVGQLTGGIAHDFNNLLAGISGSLELLQTRLSRGRTDGLDRYIRAATGSAQRAAALTHRLLSFSRMQPLDPRPVDANALVAGMEDLLRRTIGPAHAIEFVTAGGLWTTLCDPNQLENALLNLAINARDAMPDGGRLTVETCNVRLDDAYVARQRDVAPGQYVCIGITDTGVGMPPDIVARAFEPFFTTKPLGQGTGLGLSMVYGFAKQSEGHLKIYSEPGRGTTVKIYLPRTAAPAQAADEAHEPADKPQPADHGVTVLVVEDEPVIRDLVAEILAELGYRVLQAADGPSGLATLRTKERIDLVVTDVGLPGLNGRQLIDHAREVRPTLKALFITGYAENATLANGFLEPGMEMMTKPFAVDTLTSKIAQMIGAP